MSNSLTTPGSINWKPIATAPKGRAILVARYKSGRTYVDFVSKDENDFDWIVPDQECMDCGIDVPYAWAPAPKPPVFRQMVPARKKA